MNAKRETHKCRICGDPYIYDMDECDDPEICQECELHLARQKKCQSFWNGEDNAHC